MACAENWLSGTMVFIKMTSPDWLKTRVVVRTALARQVLGCMFCTLSVLDSACVFTHAQELSRCTVHVYMKVLWDAVLGSWYNIAA